MRFATPLAGALAVALAGCDRDQSSAPPPPPMTGRANTVAAKETASLPPKAVIAPATEGGSSPAKPPVYDGGAAPKPPVRQLCAGQSPRPALGSQWRAALKTAAAGDATPPPASLPIGVGKWVWINLWAAWCGPCK